MEVGAGVSSGPQSQAGDGTALSSLSWASGAPGTPSSRSEVHRALVDGLSHDRKTGSACGGRGSRPDASAVEIPLQLDWACLCIGQANVPVRPNQIHSTALHARLVHRRTPRKHVAGQPPPPADLPELRCGFAIHVHLPIKRGQWGKVVGLISRRLRYLRDPRQAITPSELARSALAQAAEPVVHRCLRDRAEHKPPKPDRPGQDWKNTGGHLNADQPSNTVCSSSPAWVSRSRPACRASSWPPNWSCSASCPRSSTRPGSP
jgi:hypothetical protein